MFNPLLFWAELGQLTQLVLEGWAEDSLTSGSDATGSPFCESVAVTPLLT